MPRLLVKSSYLKGGRAKDASGYMGYIATREGEELIPRPEIYAQYMATRPRAERGLFGDADAIELEKAMAELTEHTGNVWTHIFSLHRKDAARLGYDNAATWRNLLKAHRNDVAAAMKISPDHFRWYAAFHNEGEHPHVHMMAWSSAPREGYLDKNGIETISSVLTNDVFKQEMLQLYQQKSVSRDELVEQARETMRELSAKLKNGIRSQPQLELRLVELAGTMKTVNGRKQYGYLPNPVKRMVDDAVDELERIPEVAGCYEHWLDVRGQVQGYYTGKKPERVKLSEQKEFRSVKNAVIQAAEKIRVNEFTFEDGEMEDEQERLPWNLWELRNVLAATTETLEEWDAAIEELKALAQTGDPDAQWELGRQYRDGGALLPDEAEARRWFTLAAGRDHIAAQYALGKLCLTDDPEVRDVEAGLRWLETACQSGNQWAGYRLGKEHLQGKIVAKDVPKALEYLTATAELDNPCAQYTLGKLYLSGGEVERDEALSRHWLTRAVGQGIPSAQLLLGRVESHVRPTVALSVAWLLYDIGSIFQNSTSARTGGIEMRTDRKLRQKIAEKKRAMGLKDEPERNQGMQMM